MNDKTVVKPDLILTKTLATLILEQIEAQFPEVMGEQTVQLSRKYLACTGKTRFGNHVSNEEFDVSLDETPLARYFEANPIAITMLALMKENGVFRPDEVETQKLQASLDDEIQLYSEHAAPTLVQKGKFSIAVQNAMTSGRTQEIVRDPTIPMDDQYVEKTRDEIPEGTSRYIYDKLEEAKQRGRFTDASIASATAEVFTLDLQKLRAIADGKQVVGAYTAAAANRKRSGSKEI